MPARLEGYSEGLVSMQEEPPTLSGGPHDEGAHRQVVLTGPSVNVCHDVTAAYPRRVLLEARAHHADARFTGCESEWRQLDSSTTTCSL